MRTILIPLFRTLSGLLRTHAALHLEILPASTVSRAEPLQAKTDPPASGRSYFLVLVMENMAKVRGGTGNRQTRHGRPVAPPEFSSLLDVEVTLLQRWALTSTTRSPS